MHAATLDREIAVLLRKNAFQALLVLATRNGEFLTLEDLHELEKKAKVLRGQ